MKSKLRGCKHGITAFSGGASQTQTAYSPAKSRRSTGSAGLLGALEKSGKGMVTGALGTGM